jgi:predicted ester cyclase
MSALDNKAVHRRFVESVSNGTWAEAVNALFTTTHVFHEPRPGAPPRLATGPQGAKDYVATLLAAFPDAQLTVEDQLAEGDKVMTRYAYRCTHRGAFMGIAPTGKHVTGTVVFISRVEEGKMAETWSYPDTLGLFQQLGAFPQIAEAGA